MNERYTLNIRPHPLTHNTCKCIGIKIKLTSCTAGHTFQELTSVGHSLVLSSLLDSLSDWPFKSGITE